VGKGELVQIIVLLFTALMASSFAVPVVGGVFWRRATKEGAAAGMLGGIAAAFLWQALGPESIHAVVPGFLTSLVLWWGVSLLTPPPPPDAVAPYFPSLEPGVRP
jgi:Na+/proline symporter